MHECADMDNMLQREGMHEVMQLPFIRQDSLPYLLLWLSEVKLSIQNTALWSGQMVSFRMWSSDTGSTDADRLYSLVYTN